jgi:hypothetical protein
MKKALSLLVSLVITLHFSFTQSIIITTPTTITNGLLTPPNTIVNDDTVIFCVTDMTNTFEDGSLLVINNTASSMPVKVKRFADGTACFGSNQFCWFICYNPPTSISPDIINIASHDTATNFHGWMTPNGNDGCCFIKYRFFNSDDTLVYADVTIKYCFAHTCSESLGVEETNISALSLYPNPAAASVTVEFAPVETDGTILITDLTGKIVKQVMVPVHTTQMMVSLEGLMDGIYLCNFHINGGAVLTKKLVISK